MSTAPEPEREALSRESVPAPAPAPAHIHAHTRTYAHARCSGTGSGDFFLCFFFLKGCGGFSFFFISFFVHNSREAMRRGFASNPGLRRWLFLAPFWPVHNSRAMSPRTTLQCRPGRHSNVAHDDTVVSPRTTPTEI